MDQIQFEDISSEVLMEVTRDAIEQFKNAIARYGIELTDALKEDFQYHIIRSAGKVSAEIEFKEYGRFKDMAVLRFGAHHPPVDAMEFFVAKTGINSFSYVPGYKTSTRPPTVSTAVARIAAGIAFSMKRQVNVKRSYRGTWYNTEKALMINRAKKQLRWRTSELIHAHLRGALE
jgi:hypothetical protein